MMTGTTTQAHTLTVTDAAKKVIDFVTIPAGTTAYVSRVRSNGTCEIRLPRTLATQTVYFNTLLPA